MSSLGCVYGLSQLSGWKMKRQLSQQRKRKKEQVYWRMPNQQTWKKTQDEHYHQAFMKQTDTSDKEQRRICLETTMLTKDEQKCNALAQTCILPVVQKEDIEEGKREEREGKVSL